MTQRKRYEVSISTHEDPATFSDGVMSALEDWSRDTDRGARLNWGTGVWDGGFEFGATITYDSHSGDPTALGDLLDHLANVPDVRFAHMAAYFVDFVEVDLWTRRGS